ncbi:MAG: MMPL family transporter [Gammaproteobacteria bacterium]
MVGFLGFLRFPVTVISSNFIALLLIITMSMIIHLIVRYRELVDRYPQWTQRALIAETVGQMARPCLYTSLTTVVAFVSLLVSNIRPVIDFGIMMTMGIAFSYATAFLLFPVLLSFFAREPGDVKRQQSQDVFSVKFANLTMRMGGGLTVAALVLGVFSAWGISRLSVENRFIDYFKEKTEIYQGMKTIDEHLGGTTPLDIILDVKLKGDLENDQEDCFLDDDCLDDVYGDSTIFTQAHMAQFRDIHTWLEALPETGKVLSVITTIELAEQIKGASLNALELAFLNAMFPDDLRGLLLDPYVNEATGKVRFTLRVRESDTELKRQALLDQIHDYLVNEQGLNPEEVHFTGMVVLYNNMLKSLFKSQIATIGVVFACILIMFVVLFRSLKLALIGMLPNLLAAGVVLGMMGSLGIPLDMMTITIAAISVGIAVDNTIHYMYRFKAEFARDGQYSAAMFRSHATIGKAMYYTSITIIFGFSILTLSSFYPTIYFGLFTSLAMLIALLASLTLLPELILLIKPLGPGTAERR